MTIRTSTIPLKGGGQDFNAYLAEPEAGGPGVLLLHAWWGLKPFFKQVCDRLAEQGFVVLAPDLRQGRVAQTVDEAKALMEQSDQQLTFDMAAAAKTYLLHYPTLKGQQIGVIGFSMGGQVALYLASRVPEEIAAVVLVYGAGEGDFSGFRGKVLGHFSDVDEWEEFRYVQALEKNLKEAGVDTTFHVYRGLKHWWVEEDRPEYDAAGARATWKRTYDFLHRNVRVPGSRVAKA